MKTLKNFAQLFLVWFISIASLGAAMAMHQSNHSVTITEFFRVMIIYMIYSFICSLPAFIFFSILSMQVLRQNWSRLKKKWFILLINYTDIVGTGLFFFGFTFRGFNHLLFNIGQFYPGWVLVVASSLAILVMPFNHYPSTHSTDFNHPK